MSDKLYQIQNGAVTLYVEMKYDGTTFEFRGFTVDGDENFYQPYISPYNNSSGGNRPCIGLDQYLFDKFKALADEQLKEYLDQNLRNMSIYEVRGDVVDSLWSTAGKEPDIRIQKYIQRSRVIDGIVGLEVNHAVCLYDFVRKEAAGYRKEYQDEELDTTLLQVFYGEHLARLLALEQHKRKLAPPFYTELVKLNRFLDGKKSVKLVMKDRSVHEYKHHNGNEVSAHSLLDFNAKNAAEPFSLADSYDLKPRFGGKRAVTELDYLQHSREKHYIDPDALRQFGGRG
jgi:hypothetical protein